MAATIDRVAAESLADFDIEVNQSPRTQGDNYARSSVACYRQGQRLLEAFQPVDVAALPAIDDNALKDKHILITGGLGGLGLLAAQFVADRGCKAVSLIARSGLPARDEWASHSEGDSQAARRIAAIEQLESTGVTVNLVIADVTDQSALTDGVGMARETSGMIDGDYSHRRYTGRSVVAA